MPRPRSFQTRLFLAMVAVAVVPALVALGLGAVALREVGSSTGTLGAWDAVAGTGRELLEAVDTSPDPAVRAAAERHREALSASVRWSRLYALVTERLLGLLPLAALVAGVVIAALSAWAARGIARGVARPVSELVDWTGRIGRGERLPPDPGGGGGAAELRQLRDALRSMAADLEGARRREVESARLRAWTEMARRLAHELKNPLTPMRMAAAALARRPDPATAEPAAVLMEEIDRLDEMARSFAQLGRLPEGPPSEIDLVELAHAVAARYGDGPARILVRVGGGSDGPVQDGPRDGRGPAPALGESAAEAVPAHPWVVGHYELLLRAVQNLVVNAVEAQGGEGTVEVVVRAEDGGAVLEVLDRGPGVPVDLRGEVWRPDVTTKSHGTGLGLALVRQAATAHGGRAEVDERPGGGARFRLVLPAEPRPLARTAE